jgi:hypothetical protein
VLEHYGALKTWHKGETGLLVLNGPGLASVPLEFLNKYTTLGCNRITMMYPDFCPTYYFGMGMNQLETKDKRETILPTIADDRCKAGFINRLVIHEFAHTNKCYSWLGGQTYGASGDQLRTFSHKPWFVVGLGFTMAYPMLQIALYMGFDTMLIVGMDHEYPSPEDKHKHFYDDDEGYAGLFEVAPGVYSPQAWRRWADELMAKCQAEFEKAGKRIVNLSEPTKCDAFEKGKREDW